MLGMIKTSIEVQDDIIKLLQGSSLLSAITGEIYIDERPHNSRLEDAVVRFTAGQSKQIQEGVITINIFVPDIDAYNNGILSKNLKRLKELQQLSVKWVNSLTTGRSNYRFELERAIITDKDEAINQHFVVVRLTYEYFD